MDASFLHPLSTRLILGSVALSLLVGTGCDHTSARVASRETAATSLGSKTSSRTSQRLGAWHDAEDISAAGPGRTTVVGSGESMAPLYGDGTVLVLNRVPFGELRAGMNVAYLNREGRKVVHRLLEPTHAGWRLQGLNNGFVDREAVTPENFLGVVYASLDSTALADTP